MRHTNKTDPLEEAVKGGKPNPQPQQPGYIEEAQTNSPRQVSKGEQGPWASRNEPFDSREGWTVRATHHGTLRGFCRSPVETGTLTQSCSHSTTCLVKAQHVQHREAFSMHGGLHPPSVPSHPNKTEDLPDRSGVTRQARSKAVWKHKGRSSASKTEEARETKEANEGEGSRRRSEEA